MWSERLVALMMKHVLPDVVYLLLKNSLSQTLSSVLRDDTNTTYPAPRSSVCKKVCLENAKD